MGGKEWIVEGEHETCSSKDISWVSVCKMLSASSASKSSDSSSCCWAVDDEHEDKFEDMTDRAERRCCNRAMRLMRDNSGISSRLKPKKSSTYRGVVSPILSCGDDAMPRDQ